MSKINDITGLRFGRLVAKEMHPTRLEQGRVAWICKCDCGKIVVLPGKQIRSGRTKSCGCLKLERLRNQRGSLHPQWKGGYLVRGSTPWATQVLAKLKCNSKRHGYRGPADSVTAQDIIDLFEKANGICQICGVHELECTKQHCIDHDHVTGFLRGLLCTHCNVGLGAFRDSVDVLEKAASYLGQSQIA